MPLTLEGLPVHPLKNHLSDPGLYRVRVRVVFYLRFFCVVELHKQKQHCPLALKHMSIENKIPHNALQTPPVNVYLHQNKVVDKS